MLSFFPITQYRTVFPSFAYTDLWAFLRQLTDLSDKYVQRCFEFCSTWFLTETMIFLFTSLKVFLREENLSWGTLGGLDILIWVWLISKEWALANAITLSIDGLVLRKAFVTLRNMLLNELILTILMTCLFSNDNLIARSWLTDYLRLPSYRLNYEVAFLWYHNVCWFSYDFHSLINLRINILYHFHE